jgi:hypothetical protein
VVDKTIGIGPTSINNGLTSKPEKKEVKDWELSSLFWINNLTWFIKRENVTKSSQPTTR